MVIVEAEEPPDVGVKKGVWPVVPLEVVLSVMVAAEPALVTALPNESSRVRT